MFVVGCFGIESGKLWVGNLEINVAAFQNSPNASRIVLNSNLVSLHQNRKINDFRGIGGVLGKG